MPYGINRLTGAIKCCVLCFAAATASDAQQSSPANPPNIAPQTPENSARMEGVQSAGELFGHLVAGPSRKITTIADGDIASNHETASAIRSYTDSGEGTRQESDVRLANGESDIHPMVTQLPKLDPRLSRARRQGRSTQIDLNKTGRPAPPTGPPKEPSTAHSSPVKQDTTSPRDHTNARPRRLPTDNPALCPQPLQNAAQIIPANAPAFDGVQQAGYIDEAELSDLEQPLSIKVLNKPPVPQPFYQALAQENEKNDLRNAIEDALKKKKPEPKQEPLQRPVPNPELRRQFETPPPTQRQPEVEATPPRVQPDIDNIAPTEDDDLLFDDPLLDEADSNGLGIEALDALDKLNQMEQQSEQSIDESQIEDADQDLLNQSDAARPRKNKPRRPGEQLRLDFPSLLDDGIGGESELESLLDDESDDGDEDGFSDDDDPTLQEPEISRPKRQQTNYPTTLSQVFNDETDGVAPHVEQQFCQHIWACAGGRSQTWQDRMRCNFCRDYALKAKNCGNQQSWLGDMICNSGGGGCGSPGLLGGAGLFCSSCQPCGGLVGRALQVGGSNFELGCSTAAGGTESCGCTSCTGGGCQSSQFSIGGWTSAGYHDNANGLFNNHPERFNLHQQWFYAQREARPTNATNGRWDWGFRADVVYGVDAADTQAFGNNPGTFDFQNGFDHGIYGWALPQAYGEIAGENLSIIFGRFYTLIGYETVTAPHNFFYSHSITFHNSEPFTHTGALATYSGPDSEIYFGWTLGWDTGFDQFDGGSNFLGGFSTPLTNTLNFTYITTAGDLGWRGDGYSHSLLFDLSLSDRWNYVVQSDLLRTNQGEDNVGVNQYLFWNFSDSLAFGGRMEWWKGDGVTGYAPFDSAAPAVGSSSYYQTTIGANIRPGTKNLVFRPEMRWDWSPSLGYDESTFGIDMVLTY